MASLRQLQPPFDSSISCYADALRTRPLYSLSAISLGYTAEILKPSIVVVVFITASRLRIAHEPIRIDGLWSAVTPSLVVAGHALLEAQDEAVWRLVIRMIVLKRPAYAVANSWTLSCLAMLSNGSQTTPANHNVATLFITRSLSAQPDLLHQPQVESIGSDSAKDDVSAPREMLCLSQKRRRPWALLTTERHQQLAAILFLCVQAGLVIAQDVTITQYASTITVAYNPTHQAPTSFATSVVAQQAVISQTTTAQVTAQTAEADGSGGGTVDNDGGASGSSSGSFKISSGAIIAIVVVCVVVVIFGIASTVLFVVAKRRQWNVRASIARASRRLTGRFGNAKPSQRDPEAARRTGTYFGAPPRPGVKAVMPPGHKRGFVVNVQPVQEKRSGPLAGQAPQNTRPREQTWMKNLWGNGWK